MSFYRPKIGKGKKGLDFSTKKISYQTEYLNTEIFVNFSDELFCDQKLDLTWGENKVGQVWTMLFCRRGRADHSGSSYASTGPRQSHRTYHPPFPNGSILFLDISKREMQRWMCIIFFIRYFTKAKWTFLAFRTRCSEMLRLDLSIILVKSQSGSLKNRTRNEKARGIAYRLRKRRSCLG